MPAQLFFFVLLPLGIAVGGLVYGEVFRARQMRSSERPASNTSPMRTPEHFVLTPEESFVHLTPEETKLINERQHSLRNKLKDTPVATLRRVYGRDFASGFSDSERLADVLYRLDKESFARVMRDDEAGKLDEILRNSSTPPRR
jgi:hypothetical protein